MMSSEDISRNEKLIDQLHKVLNEMIASVAAGHLDPRTLLTLLLGSMCHILQNMGKDLPAAQYQVAFVMNQLWPIVEQQK